MEKRGILPIVRHAFLFGQKIDEVRTGLFECGELPGFYLPNGDFHHIVGFVGRCVVVFVASQDGRLKNAKDQEILH